MKKVLKNKVFWCVVILVSIIIIVGVYGYSIFLDVKSDVVVEEKEVVNGVIENELGEFVLYSDSSDYQRELFDTLVENNLVDGASTEQVEAYVDSYSKNFVADFLTLNVKDPLLNRVGGKQFLVEALQSSYEELDGVADYYISKEYYIQDNEDTYTTTLPEVSSLELVSIENTSVDYYDATSQNADKEDMAAYSLNYNISYTTEPIENGFVQYETIEVIVANWDGVWTVVEIRTDLYKSNPTVISMY